MQLSFKRAKRAPLFATLALAALLLVPVSANAAMGGANPAVGTLTPNLRSANVTGVDTVAGKTTVQVCWDKAIASLPQPGLLKIGTYRQGSRNGVPPGAPPGPTTPPANEAIATSATRVGTSCADVVYSTVLTDPTQFTYLHTPGGAVVSADQAKPNNADSTALIIPGGLGTHTGTAGHNASPSLTGCTVNVGTSTVNYLFDMNIGFVAAGATTFRLETFNGTPINNSGAATDISFSGNVVSVKFPGGVIGNGVRCVVSANVIQGLSERSNSPSSLNPTVQVAAVPGNSGNVDSVPNLQSAEVSADGCYIEYVFGQLVGVTNVAAFHAILADGRVINGSNASEFRVVNNNAVRFYWGNGVAAPGAPSCGATSNYNEHLVNAAVDPGAVTGAGGANFEGFTPLGGNQGAFASGFTMAPEALRATFDTTTGEVSVLLDQRFVFGIAPKTVLLDDTGQVIGGAPPLLGAGAGGAAGQKTAVFRFTTAQLAGARSVMLLGEDTVPFAGFGSVISNVGYGNVSQIVSPTATAKALTKSRARWHRSKKASKKYVRAHRAKAIRAKRLHKH